MPDATALPFTSGSTAGESNATILECVRHALRDVLTLRDHASDGELYASSVPGCVPSLRLHVLAVVSTDTWLPSPLPAFLLIFSIRSIAMLLLAAK